MSEVSLDTAPAITINLDNIEAAVKQEQSIEAADHVGNGTNGVEGNPSTELDAYPEGRTTPTPESESANFLSRNPSFIASTPPDSSIPNSAPPSTGTAPRATIGLGPLSGEDQLKSSLTSNDRLFLLIVAKEVEAFMMKVKSGENPNIIPSIPVATNSTSALASMSASFIVGSHVSSTFQRMLVYKLAEWYGLKAVHVQDVAMIIGVVGSFDTRGLSLRLADLAQNQDTAPPKIKIMQRAQNNSPSANGSSRPGSTITDDSQSGPSPKAKTLEEREQAYAKAKQRIYGNTINSTPPESSVSAEDTSALEPPAQIVPVQAQSGRRAVHNDDFETASREREDPYANSYQNQNPYGSYGYNQQQVMPQYGYHPHMNQHIPQYGNQPQQYMAGPSFMPMYGHQPPPPQNPYAAQGQWVQVPQNYHQMPNTQWIPNPNIQGQGHQPMPMIPQGMQYPAYGYPQQPQPHQQQQQQQQNYGYLVQPVPMRPPPHPHSSASSSISSRSYHSYHDASRPHSRGSTTSNMSATSSVRFGNLYPANQGGGTYRQTRRKHHGVNGINAPIGEGSDRRERDHSPASRSNGSSHSSRRPESINLIPPSQHPLPQRPDWAANNIQYHPSPGPQTHTQSQSQSPGQSPTDFPPLRQGGGTHAEPMQVERTKMRPLNGTAWNGVKLGITSPISDHSVISPRMSVSAPVSAVPTVPAPSTPRETAITIPPIDTTPQVPISISTQNTVKEPKPKSTNGERESKSKSTDEDFPRRPPNSQQLYNPNPIPSITKPTIEEMIPGKIPAEVIEAKLAAISIKEGVTIGPPANKKVASYAKIVRRD